MKTKWMVKFSSLKTLALLAAGLMATQLASGQQIPAPPGIISWWPGDGNANDIFGDNNGMLLGGANASAAGNVGQAFDFNGTSAYVGVPASPSLDLPGGMTIEMWIMPYVPLSQQQSWARLVDNSSDPTNSLPHPWHGWRLITPGSQVAYPFLGTGTLLFEAWDEAGSWKYVLAGEADVLSANQWSHLAATYDQQRGEMRIYVNGAVRAANNVGSFRIPSAETQLTIGRNNTPPTPVCFNGRIDEPTFYRRALSSNEVAVIYAAGAAGKCKDPLIVQHPQPETQVGYWGKSATFTVAARGTQPMHYQWRKDGVPLAGATSSVLTLSNLDATSSGAYTVTVSNTMASVTTYPAQLSVSSVETSFALYGGILMKGVVGQTYGVQVTTELSNTNIWVGVTNITMTVPTQIWYDSQPATQPQRYYRVVPGPISIP